MKITIIKNDNAVYLNGIIHSNLDLSFIPSNIHALQWKDTVGSIEYSEDSDGNKPHNDKIDNLPGWANTAINSWITANSEISYSNTANTP
jgi:hypothetical protein